MLGAGGVGGYFGARLLQGGADVAFIARGAHLDALRNKGLVIEDAEGKTQLTIGNVYATEDPKNIGVVDFVVLAVKLWDTEKAIQLASPLIGAHTTIISLQNGVLKDDYLRAAYDRSQLMGGVAYVATTISRPGIIKQTGSLERLVLGEFDG